ncbi:unnamed protein product, partial [Polarella glacialis]
MYQPRRRSLGARLPCQGFAVVPEQLPQVLPVGRRSPSPGSTRLPQLTRPTPPRRLAGMRGAASQEDRQKLPLLWRLSCVRRQPLPAGQPRRLQGGSSTSSWSDWPSSTRVAGPDLEASSREDEDQEALLLAALESGTWADVDEAWSFSHETTSKLLTSSRNLPDWSPGEAFHSPVPLWRSGLVAFSALEAAEEGFNAEAILLQSQ